MILLLGASGYIGRIFSRELRRRGHEFIPVTRRAIDYGNFDLLFDYVRKIKPAFIINAAGYVGKSSVDACELAREEALQANTILPQIIAKVCLMTNTPWGHISSAGIYTGAKILREDGMIIEKKFSRVELLDLLAGHSETIRGFTESDEPNFSFRQAPCSFYSGTKALAEEAIRGVGQNYIWRLGVPFNERKESGNFLAQIQSHAKVYDGVNMFSQTEDFVRACLELWEGGAPFGIYNLTNPGAVSSREVVELIRQILKPDRGFEFLEEDSEVHRDGSRTLHSNCVLDVSKFLATGGKMPAAREALEEALHKWSGAPVMEKWIETSVVEQIS